MVGLGPLAIVEAWERGAGGLPHERALSVLEAATPNARAALADLPIGERDAALLEVRARLWGDLIEGTSVCTECGETLELVFELADVRGDGERGRAKEPFAVDHDGYSVVFRLPNSRDLAAIAHSSDAEQAAHVLLERCVLEVNRDGGRLDGTSLSPELAQSVEAAMAAADPHGDLEVEALCPACAAPHRVAFDAASYVWAELEAHARSVLRDVHDLARAYGWSESEILALTPARRAHYLELVYQ